MRSLLLFALYMTFNRLCVYYNFIQKLCKPLVKKRPTFFQKIFNSPISLISPISLPPIPLISLIPPISQSRPTKKTDISFSVAIIAEISDFDSMPKIGFLFFLFLASFSQDEIYFAKIFYRAAKFFVKSPIFFAPTFLVIHSYLFIHPNISLNAAAIRSKMETFCAPV